MSRASKLAGTALLLVAAVPAQTGLAKHPLKITAGGTAVDVDLGHAAPFFADFDGDGLRDLLVGQAGQGHLRIYKNVGTKAQPKFADFELFEAGGTTAKVPTG